jgi:hypothetical protein
MNNPDQISERLETIFWVKILKFFDADPGWKKLGSGINIPDPHHRKSDFPTWTVSRKPSLGEWPKMTIILFWTTVAVWPAQWISPQSSLWHRPRFTVSISQDRVSRLKDHSSCAWRGNHIKEILYQRLCVCVCHCVKKQHCRYGTRLYSPKSNTSVIVPKMAVLWIRIHGFDNQKLTKNTTEKNYYLFLSKIAIYFSLGLLKRRPS